MGLDKINIIRKQKKISVNELVKLSGVPKGTLSKITAGITKNPNLETVQAIAKALKCSVDDFDTSQSDSFYVSDNEKSIITDYRKLDERGKKVITIILSAELEQISTINKPEKQNYMTLGVSCQRAAAGTGVFLEDEEMYKINVVFNHLTARADFCVPVDGNSMLPKYKDGDILLIHEQPDVEIGEIGIFTLDGKGYVKKRGTNKLISLNKNYDDIDIQDGKIAICNGKVIGVLDPEWIIN